MTQEPDTVYAEKEQELADDSIRILQRKFATDAWTVYKNSDANLTTNYYRLLDSIGPIGIVAHLLMCAQKASTRAKKYRGGIKGKGSFRSMAYDRKGWALEQLCKGLAKHGAVLGIPFGWKVDPDAMHQSKDVLYVELPTGQVSFHSEKRYEGPDYAGEWDGIRSVSDQRIIAFCNQVTKSQKEKELSK